MTKPLALVIISKGQENLLPEATIFASENKNPTSEIILPHCVIESGVEETAPKGKNYSVMGVK